MFTRMRLAAIGVILALVAIASLGAANISAETTPTIEGEVEGIELCPQFRCGMAIFTGRFNGTISSELWGSVYDVYDPNGVWRIAVRHGALGRNEGDVTNITFGLFSLDAGGRTIKGYVQGGQLTTTQEGTGWLADGAKFDIEATLKLTRGAFGTLYFVGELDHTNVPLVTVDGTLSQ